MSDHPAFKVLIVGGGCAALEAAFRLQRVAEGKVDTTILAPDEHFVTQALAVLVPFAAGHAPHESLAGMASAAGARHRRGRLASVDSANHRVLTDEGETIGYDALLIAVGAVKCAPYPNVVTFGNPAPRSACTVSSRISRGVTSVASPSWCLTEPRGRCRSMSWRS